MGGDDGTTRRGGTARERGRRPAPTVVLVAETAGWTVLLTGPWVATLTAVGPVELGVGAGCAAVCGVLATVSVSTRGSPGR